MAIGKQLPDKIEAHCKDCDWEGIIYKKDIPLDSIAVCPECNGYVLKDNI